VDFLYQFCRPCTEKGQEGASGGILPTLGGAKAVGTAQSLPIRSLKIPSI
jgi:hypothetical protein